MLQKGKQLSSMQKDISNTNKRERRSARNASHARGQFSCLTHFARRTKERENASDLISNSKYSTLSTKSLTCLCKWITAVKKKTPQRLRGQYPNLPSKKAQGTKWLFSAKYLFE